MKARAKTPQQAKTFKDICEIPSDNVSGTTWWFMLAEVGDTVTLNQQRSGGASTGSVKIPREEWDALVRWYTTGVWTRDLARSVLRK